MKKGHSEDKIKNGVFGAMMQVGYILPPDKYSNPFINVSLY